MLSKECRLKLCEDRLLRRTLEPKGQKVSGWWEERDTEELTICTIQQTLLR
jgi:hypothetical protein